MGVDVPAPCTACQADSANPKGVIPRHVYYVNKLFRHVTEAFWDANVDPV